jgi:hypothetical protein
MEARRHQHACCACGAGWAHAEVHCGVTEDVGAGGGDAALCARCRNDRRLYVPLLLELAAGADPQGLRAEAWRRWANDVRRDYRLRLLIAVVYAGLAAFMAGVFFEQWWCAR